MLHSNLDGRIGKGGAQVSADGTFVSMDVATDYFRKGEKRTMWIRVYLGKNIPKKMIPYLTQGKAVHIEGEQGEDNRWIGKKDGEAHSQHVITAESIKFLNSGSKKQGETAATEDIKATENNQTTPVEENPFPAPEEKTDDLPF